MVLTSRRIFVRACWHSARYFRAHVASGSRLAGVLTGGGGDAADNCADAARYVLRHVELVNGVGDAGGAPVLREAARVFGAL